MWGRVDHFDAANGPTSQPGFFDVVVLPLYSLMAEAIPALEPMLRQVKKNQAMWLAR